MTAIYSKWCLILVAAAVIAAADTGTVVFQFGGGSASGCFKTVVDATPYAGDSTASSLSAFYFPGYREHDLLGVGFPVDADTGDPMVHTAYFRSNGLVRYLQKLDSAGQTLDTATLSAKITGKQYTGYPWTLRNPSDFYSRAYANSGSPKDSMLFRMGIETSSTASYLITSKARLLDVDSSGPTRLVRIDISSIVKTALAGRLFGKKPAAEFSVGLTWYCICGIGLCMTADETSGTIANRPQLVLSGGFVPKSSLAAAAAAARRPETLSASPNPFGEAVSVRFTSPGRGRTVITIHDPQGRTVRTLLDASVPGGNEVMLVWNGTGDTGGRLPHGIYIVRARTEKSLFCRKIVLRD